MTGIVKGAILGGVQVAMLLAIGGKLLVDRATMPHVWVRCAPYDPNLPIRGRYVSLQITAQAIGFPDGIVYDGAQLSVVDGKLIARPIAEHRDAMVTVNGPIATLSEPVAYFIPEHVDDPSIRKQGEELWVEVTIPSAGPPRPIRLGVKKDGVLTPVKIE